MTPDRTAAAIGPAAAPPSRSCSRSATPLPAYAPQDAGHLPGRGPSGRSVPHFPLRQPRRPSAISDAVSKNGGRKAPALQALAVTRSPPWRERALNAEAALKTAQAEIAAQRRRMAILLGQIRDLEHDLSPEAAQRLATENTTLKQRVRQLNHDNKTLEDRLEAARSNNRFADRRIAQLKPSSPSAPPAR